ncbi:MAG TPA: 1-(5-phosphoribosyl)-5-[(5-phosphoribosylamino)methylideneamino]imidazole-4-carboxamide isomerase [Bacteroidales bacterium]|nr:1-(5-phosphoribosyl)-5-[(5-phosphoribosylamino)methylideneamino]imidazole-4-carboxamide isomerase [Bacteroidales bacterium]
MRIIIAIDIMGGKCVRLTRGDFDSGKTYYDDPLEVARMIEDNGINYLHLVDLDGAKQRKIVNLDIVEKIASQTTLKIDFGGGIRSGGDVRSVLDAGAIQVTAGSVAATNRKLFLLWLKEFGPEKIILGADGAAGKISSCGWTESSDNDIVTFIKAYHELGVKYTICTDIEKDGMLEGPSVDLYREILAVADVKLIASGGITTMHDLEALEQTGCDGAIIGKAVYEGRLSLKELGKLC